MTQRLFDLLPVDCDAVLLCVSAEAFLHRHRIVLEPVIRSLSERKQKRCRHRIVFRIIKSILCRYASVVGKKRIPTLIMRLREFRHIKCEKLPFHDHGAFFVL